MRKVSFILGAISLLALIFPALSLSQVTYIIDLSEPYSYVSGTNPIPNTSWLSDYNDCHTFCLSPTNDGYFDLSLGNFAFQFYGVPVTTLRISTNGYITVGTAAVPPQEGQEFINYPIPDPTPPHGLIAPFWTDLNLTNGGQVRWGIFGTSPLRQLVVEWVDVPSYYTGRGPYSFEAILYESTDKIKFQYTANVPDGGAFSTVGVENFDGTSGSQFSYLGIPSVGYGMVIEFIPKVTTIFFDDFSTEKGWTGYDPSGWERRPAVAGGGQNGNPDPGVDHSPSTDNYILGFAIGADYPNSFVEKWVISPPIDCTVQDRVFLKFWRYLNVESNNYDHARVSASNDGANWTQLWENPVLNVTDNQWTQVVFDISSIAAHQGTVYIKFTMGPTNATGRYSGWNIDDLEVTSDYNGPMALYVPSGGIPNPNPNPNIDEIMIKNGLGIKHDTAIPNDLSGYDLLIVSDDGACNPTTANYISFFLQYGGGVILMGGTPNLLAGNTGDLSSISDWFGAGTYGNDCGYANPVIENPLETPLSINDKVDSTPTSPCGSASVDNLNPGESMKISAWGVGGTTHSFTHSFGLGNLYYYAGNPGYSGDSDPTTVGNGLTLFEAGLFWAVAGCTMPSIIIQPQSQPIQSGQTATLSVVATDATSLNYQWYQGTSGDISNLISGATSSTYTTPVLTQTTNYWVRVYNSCGSYTDSDTAVITITGSCSAPNITSPPQSQTIQSGQTAILTVNASGTTPFSYQWYQGLAGDTSTPVGTNFNTYTTPALTQTTSYWVGVTNSCGSANSNTATITVATATVGISVVSPNGGETWLAGSTQTISWNYTGNPGSYVKVELLKGGALNSTIASSVSKGTEGNGSRTWTIPATQAPGIDYRIRVTSTTNGAYTDTSDSDFPIPAPTITLVSPNGGETWPAGSIQMIRWSYTGNPGSYVKIELLKGGVVNRTIVSAAPKGSGGSGSRSWTIPANQTPGTDYSIRVTSTTNGAYTDTSDTDFTFAAPTITVVSANGGETWPAGSMQTIRWSYTGNPGSYVKIELLKGGVLNSTIVSRVPKGTGGSGSRSWTIPANQTPGTDYSIRVTSTTNGAYTDTSDTDFTIAAPTITVVSANGGETWPAGSMQTIRWSYTGNPGSYVKIELLKGGVVNSTIVSRVPKGTGGSGSRSWTIPANQAPGTDYSIRVTSTTNGAYTDTSDSDFTIAAPTITVVSANGGETWPAGSMQTIRWSYTGNPGSYVKIELLKGGVVNSTIASVPKGTGGNGSRSWTIPASQAPGTDYCIRVTSTTNGAYTDTGDSDFTIQ